MKLCECGCGRPAPLASENDASRGWRRGEALRFCKGHHQRRTIEQRIADYVVRSESGCWIWTAALDTNGYPLISVDGKTCKATRKIYERLIGAIPPGLQLDHLCRVRACVNPAHLEPVTQAENIRRGWEARRRAA